MTTYGYVGLGMMGSAMCGHLAGANLGEVLIHDTPTQCRTGHLRQRTRYRASTNIFRSIVR